MKTVQSRKRLRKAGFLSKKKKGIPFLVSDYWEK